MRTSARLPIPFLALFCIQLLVGVNTASGAETPHDKWNHRIASAKLVAPGVGWVALQEDWSGNDSPTRLYWTEDNGRHWRNITPSGMVTHNVNCVFFLDHKRGWFLSSETLWETPNATTYLYMTDDAGKSWQSVQLRRSMFDIPDDYAGPSQLFFSDANHGWMLWHWHIMHSSNDYIISTQDGGRSWKRLPEAPGAGPLQFLSENDGWSVGTSTEDVGIPVRDDALFLTHDAGQHWTQVNVPVPAEMNFDALDFAGLRFKSQRVGSVLLSQQFLDGHFVTVALSTKDEGKTWSQSTTSDPPQAYSLLGDNLIRAFRDSEDHRTGNLYIQDGKQTIKSTMPDVSSGYSFPAFLDHSNAWMNTSSFLLATTDGGASFRVILPSSGEPDWFPEPYIRAVNGIPGDLNLATKDLKPVVAGGLTVIQGTGFLSDNVISIDNERLNVSTDDSGTLRFIAPRDLTSGPHSIRIENVHGKSEPVVVLVCGLGPPRILAIHSGAVDISGTMVAYRGKPFILEGCGFLDENRVVFDEEILEAPSKDGTTISVSIPASLLPRFHEIYVANENGSSDTVGLIVK